MILNILTLRHQTLSVDVDGSEKIRVLKQRIFEKYGGDFLVEKQRLIWAGGVLDDNRTLDTYNINAEKSVVVLTTPKEPQDSKQAPPMFGDMTHEINTIADDEYEKAVTNLIDMGFTRSLVEIALNVSYKNQDRALDYLLNLTNPRDENAGAPTSSRQITTKEAEVYQQRLGEALIFLHSNREFQKFRKLVRQSPDFLLPLLGRLQDANPGLYRWINENEDAFVLAMNEPDTDAPSHGTGAFLPDDYGVMLSVEEKSAVNRLIALGFAEKVALEAFIACDKNELLAANLLSDCGGQM